MKVVMVPVADRPECRAALDAAFGLATRLSANVVGYHLRPHREENAFSAPRLGVLLEDGELPEAPPETARLNKDHARKLFREMARERGIPLARKPRDAPGPLAFWYAMIGMPEKLFSIIGPTSDCIVLSRPRPRGSGPARAFLLAALLRSGKPLLVLPQRRVAKLGRRVLVASNQSVEAAAAVCAALPLLALAEEVHILCCGKEDLPGPKTRHLQNYLLHNGIASRRHESRGRDPSGEILDAYRETGADLLVMGAYSRGQLRERILGGVTHEMLFRADIPVFALHP